MKPTPDELFEEVGSVDRLLALRAQPPAVDARTAEAVARDLYGLTTRATPLDGERDRNFQLETADGQTLVLKFIDREADDVVIAGQSAMPFRPEQPDIVVDAFTAALSALRS